MANMRMLNSFASGVSSGIGAGSQIANRKTLTDLAVAGDAREGEKMGLLKAADARQTKLYDQYAKIIDKYLGDTGSANLQATLTETVGQAAPTTDAFQPTLAGQAPNASMMPSPIQQQLGRMQATAQPRRAMPPFADLIGYGG